MGQIGTHHPKSLLELEYGQRVITIEGLLMQFALVMDAIRTGYNQLVSPESKHHIFVKCLAALTTLTWHGTERYAGKRVAK